MARGKAAAALATFAVGFLVVAVAYGVAAAVDGAYLLVVAPAAGVAIAAGVWASLRRVCTTGSERAERSALAGIMVLILLAVLGISFGGASLFVPAASLALAAALTPRPRARRSTGGACRG